MSILLKAMLQMSASKRNAIASTMAFGAGSVRRMFKVSVLTNVPGMDIVVVVFVRSTRAFRFFSTNAKFLLVYLI